MLSYSKRVKQHPFLYLLHLRLVDHGEEPASDVVETGAEFRVENPLVGHQQVGHAANIGEGDTLTDQEGLELEMLVESGQGLCNRVISNRATSNGVFVI